MIKPDRHTNLNFAVINISASILSELSTVYSVKYDVLLEKIVKKIGEESRVNFPYALDFLFLLGKLKYDQNTDSFISNEIK